MLVTKMRKVGVKGFSLVELMVVVAIIGILAAVAIPNFQRFQRKARQSEARANLGGLYTAQSAFRGEWEGYHGNFLAIGYVPVGAMRYNLGFTAVGFVPPAPFVPAPAAFAGAFSTNAACGLAAPFNECTAPADALVGVVNPTATTFTAAAAGQIGGTTNPVDQWTMTNSKVLTNTVDGSY